MDEGRTAEAGGDEASGEAVASPSSDRGGGKRRLTQFLLLTANRWTVTAVVVGLVFGALVVAGAVAPVSLGTLVGAGDPVGTLFQALVTAIITGVTVVVTITQLVLSQELGPLGDQRERMAETMAVREEAAALIDEPVSPLEPAAFLRTLLATSQARAARLAEASEGVGDPARSRIEGLVETVSAETRGPTERLAGAEFGTFAVLAPALAVEYSVLLHDARRLRAQHGDDLPAAASEGLDDLVDLLTLFGPAREHVKTLYFQWELTNLSREILIVSVPALVVALLGVVYLDDPAVVTGTTLGVDNLVWVVSAGATVAIAPFALFLSYVLRVVTVAKRTLAIGPFVLQPVDRSAGLDWDDAE